MKTTRTSLEDYLKTIVEKQPEGIINEVVKEALNYAEQPEVFFKNVANFGCIDNIVKCLFLDKQAWHFFDKYYTEIDVMRGEYKINIPYNVDLKVFLARTAFEKVTERVYRDWENGS